MNDNQFFKPTVLYKEYMILDMIEKNSNITQREMSKTIGVAVSMVNQYLDEYEKKGLIKKKKHSTKTVEYFVTKKGTERGKILNVYYFNESLKVFNSAKENIMLFLSHAIKKGFTNILLYGAGEIAEILLQSIVVDNSIKLHIGAVIDDDKSKQGKLLVNYKIISLEEIHSIRHDGILISSYTNRKIIFDRLKAINYDETRILHFFN
jgi:DNA-binding MarR family transcriptional regulator